MKVVELWSAARCLPTTYRMVNPAPGGIDRCLDVIGREEVIFES
jgi:hypothetical protein